jgi:hypothetical protein
MAEDQKIPVPPVDSPADVPVEEPTLAYTVRYEVMYKTWKIWQAVSDVDVAYFTVSNTFNPDDLIYELVKLLGLDKGLKSPKNFKNTKQKGVRILGIPKKVTQIPRLEP